MTGLTNLYGLFISEIAAATVPLGIEKYRANQIAEWIYKRGVTNFELMINLPLVQRKKLAEHCAITAVTVQAEQHSADSKTSKYLLAYADGQAVETVLMRQPYGNSVCVSTQVGCAMGCLFCASTLGGVVRDLTGGEILSQVMHFQHQLVSQGQKVDSIVLMGAGEPLMNYEQVMRFIRLCHEPYTLGLSYRSFTLSSSGIVPAIRQLANERLPLTLAISLHAPNDALRSKLMPINKRYPIAEVIAAADYYANITGRRVTYEYTLIRDMNDQTAHAQELVNLLKGHLANVNLIPVNPVPERGLHRPSPETITKFEYILSGAGITVNVRREMGTDIQAACGQLRRSVVSKNPL